MFSAGGDPQEWRRECARRADFTITAVDKGKDKAYLTFKATLAIFMSSVLLGHKSPLWTKRKPSVSLIIVKVIK